MSSLFHDRPGPRFAVPETILAYLRRDIRELLDIGPDLSEQDCLRLINGAAYLDALVFEAAYRVKNRPVYEARMRLPEPQQLPERKPPHHAPNWPDASQARWKYAKNR